MQNIGFNKRLLAYIIDELILVIPVMVLWYLFFNPQEYLNALMESFSGGQTSDLSLTFNKHVLFITLVKALYYIGMWLLNRGATLGKMILKIRVVSYDGKELTQKQALLRYTGYILAGFLYYIPFIWIIWDKEQQGLHDKLAGTRVVSF